MYFKAQKMCLPTLDLAIGSMTNISKTYKTTLPKLGLHLNMQYNPCISMSFHKEKEIEKAGNKRQKNQRK